MPGSFDQDTAVTRGRRPDGSPDDRFEATVAFGYSVPGGAPNGGYLTALAGRALTERLGVPDPLTVTTHYLAPPSAAPVTILTEALKATGRHRTGVARVLQDDVEVLRVTGTCTDLAAAKGPTVMDGGPPDVPAFEDCILIREQDHLPEMFSKTELAVTPASLSWALGDRTNRAVLEGWTGIRDVDRVPTLGVLFLADAFVPPIFNLDQIPFGWMPTVELTVQVRAVPAPGRLRIRVSTRFITDGYLDVDTELWDADDRLVGLARQTALAPRTT